MLPELQSDFMTDSDWTGQPHPNAFLHYVTIHFVILLATLFSIPPALYAIYKDYAAFLALGPGGTPSTFSGYLRITFLRLFALKDTYTPAAIPTKLFPAVGHLSPATVSTRRGMRPRVSGIAPHRQMTQRGTLENFHALSKAIADLVEKHSFYLQLGTSCFEKVGTGLFSINSVNQTCRGEICHWHLSDGSLHLTLHPSDAKVVLERGWGERHPLARGGWLSRFVPCGFVLVYAPRDEEELRVVMDIVKAAAWWVRGEVLPGVAFEGRDVSDDGNGKSCSIDPTHDWGKSMAQLIKQS